MRVQIQEAKLIIGSPQCFPLSSSPPVLFGQSQWQIFAPTPPYSPTRSGSHPSLTLPILSVTLPLSCPRVTL